MTLHVDPTFSRRIAEWAAAAGKTIGDAFKTQARLYCNELIQRTPPFSGKTIVRMLSGRKDGASLRDVNVESLSALAVGKRRVEKDIRKVIYGVRGASLVGDRAAMANAVDWGTLQKCEGKTAVRVFATKGGEVYGVDTANFVPDADMSKLSEHHRANRTARGRVTSAGQRTRNVGRWRWLDVLVTKESAVKKYVAKIQKHVGRARGGWAEAYIQLGGRMSRSGWVGKHAAKTGAAKIMIKPYNVDITIINKSEWSNRGDDERIRASAMAGRDRAIKADIERLLKEKWG